LLLCEKISAKKRRAVLAKSNIQTGYLPDVCQTEWIQINQSTTFKETYRKKLKSDDLQENG